MCSSPAELAPTHIPSLRAASPTRVHDCPAQRAMNLYLILPRLTRAALGTAVIASIAAAGAATLRPVDADLVTHPVRTTPPQIVKPGAELHLSAGPAHRLTRKALPPQPRSLTVRVIVRIPIQQGTAWVNKCAGAVAATYPGVPTQIVEHDYCGGLWVLGLRDGEHVRFTGAVNGAYVVNGRRKTIRDGTAVTAATGLGDMVAQTCIPGSSQAIQWVGLTRIAA